MALVEASYDSLPYIDAEPTQNQRDAAQRMLTAELPAGYQKNLHSSIPPLPLVKIPTSIEAEFDRIARSKPMEGGIDSGLYEAPEEPSADAPEDAWRSEVTTASALHSYLTSRHTDLALLEEHGKNAWLIGNSQLEDRLKGLEREMENTKEQTDNVNRGRKSAQEGSRGEMVGLGETWRMSIDKILEIQVGTDVARQEVLKRRRAQAH